MHWVLTVTNMDGIVGSFPAIADGQRTEVEITGARAFRYQIHQW